MRTDRSDGGAAFPTADSDYMWSQDGMTLRDWFAGQWIAAGYYSNLSVHEAADQAYEMADAMLDERNK